MLPLKNNPYKQTKKTNDKLEENMCKLYHRKCLQS